MHETMRRSRLMLLFVALLKITSLYGLKYDDAFYVQQQPIQFSREPDNVFTLSRTDVNFVCSIKTSNGFSDITWLYNNNTVIKAGSNYKISSNVQGRSILMIRNVSIQDQGDYHCCVSEWRTKIRSRPGRLHVMATGNMGNYNDGNVTNKYNVTAFYKSTVILPCHLKLNTKPVWLHNHLVLTSKEVNQTVLVDENGDLVLVNVSSVHNGHYQCQSNVSGTIIDGSSYQLTVQNSTGNIDDLRKSSSQHLLIIPDNCDSSPHNQTVTLQCQVTGYPSPVISWYLNGGLVNFTEYNITDNVGNNTWIIQGGNPCRLIGYWQCFATNEVGTVHNDIRVLPFGWSNPPGELMLNITNLRENLINHREEVIDAYSSVNVTISWSPPQYLGGLNTSDIYYQLRINGDSTITTDTYSFKSYDNVNFHYGEKTLNIRVTVHYNGSTVNHLYIPSSILVKKYDNLLCDALEFKPPQISAQCFENGTVYFNWSASPDQDLSEPYLDFVYHGWFLSGECSHPNGTNPIEKYEKDTKSSSDDMIIENVSNGMTCTYEVKPDIDGCDCKASCQTSTSCNVVYVSPTTSYTVPSSFTTATVAFTTSLESSSTAMDSFVTATPSIVMDTNNVTTTDNIIGFATTVFTTTTFVSSISSTASHFSTVVVTDNLTTQHTSNGLSTTTPSVTTSSGSNMPTSLLIAIGVLIVLLIGSVIFFFTVLYIYRWKSTGKNADIRFLKMSQTIKMMKPPLSNNYCSTINVADESVCEIPVNKVKRWIDDNDFKQNEDALRSESFQSLATSQMFAYIHKHDKTNSKQLSMELLDDYIDDIQMENHLESVCSNINDEVYETSNCLVSSYIDEAHLNQKSYLTSANSCQCNSYCEESTAFNNLSHPNPCHNSLPDYIEESSCQIDTKASQKYLSQISCGSPTFHHIEIPDKLHISKDGSTCSLPALVPCVSNPVFASFDLLHCSSNQTTDSIQIVTSISDFHLTDKDDQQQSNKSNHSIDTPNCRLTANPRLHTDSIKALPNVEYYEMLSTNKEINCIHNSTSDLSLCDSHSDVSIDVPSSGNQTSSLGYIELPGDNSKSTCTDSGTSTRKSFLSELDFDSDSCDIAATSNNACSPNVDLGYVHLPCQTESVEEEQLIHKTIDNLTMKNYILSLENVV